MLYIYWRNVIFLLLYIFTMMLSHKHRQMKWENEIIGNISIYLLFRLNAHFFRSIIKYYMKILDSKKYWNMLIFFFSHLDSTHSIIARCVLFDGDTKRVASATKHFSRFVARDDVTQTFVSRLRTSGDAALRVTHSITNCRSKEIFQYENLFFFLVSLYNSKNFELCTIIL